MVTRIAFVAVAAQAFVLALSGGAQAQAPASSGGIGGCGGEAQIATDPPARQAAAAALVCLINVERVSRALRPVAVSALLTKAAAFHSGDMVRRRYFAHISPGGLDLRARVSRTGYVRGSSGALLGETIAWGAGRDGSPAELVKTLMGSPVHRAIVLDGRYRDIGAGLSLGAPMDGMGGGGATLSLAFGRR